MLKWSIEADNANNTASTASNETLLSILCRKPDYHMKLNMKQRRKSKNVVRRV